VRLRQRGKSEPGGGGSRKTGLYEGGDGGGLKRKTLSRPENTTYQPQKFSPGKHSHGSHPLGYIYLKEGKAPGLQNCGRFGSSGKTKRAERRRQLLRSGQRAGGPISSGIEERTPYNKKEEGGRGGSQTPMVRGGRKLPILASRLREESHCLLTHLPSRRLKQGRGKSIPPAGNSSSALKRRGKTAKQSGHRSNGATSGLGGSLHVHRGSLLMLTCRNQKQ